MMIESSTPLNPIAMLRPQRRITGISAILLPFTAAKAIDWDGLCAHVTRTAAAGITPAVNMDTGYANLIDEATRERVLDETRAALGGGAFVAGAFVGDLPGAALNIDAYARQIERIQKRGGTPIIFQSYGLTSQPNDAILASYASLARYCDEFIGFELGTMFVPFGKIYDLDTFTSLLAIPQCTGVKHSSLSRELEWQRLRVRDQRRPDFKVFTGNDLAIDMVMYGSDYLLGLSTFAPDLFAKRDRMWEAGDSRFYELNDLLQYLGMFAFRVPVPAYKHSAAQFLRLRGWIASDEPHPASPRRPLSDVDVLRDIHARLREWE
ncbi:MAG: dihydrodipicolinate synthase family protein [Chloroflexota bacterium]|nr:dihydrodipicolinate synthase family protein [Chloroflexota bacterium]